MTIRQAIKAYRAYCAAMGLKGSRAGRRDWVEARVA